MSRVRAPVLAAIVAGLHVVVVGSFFFVQGCGTTQSVDVEAPPPPVMPPRPESQVPVSSLGMPKPSFQPPSAETASTSLEGAGGQTYVVQSGDSISKIAARVGVTTRELVELNKIKEINKIRVGQKLILPAYAKEIESASPGAAPKAKAKVKAKPAAATPPAVAGEGEYVVRSGDSLSKVAVKHGVSIKALREVNNLKGDTIRIGQKLKLPVSAATAAEAAPAAPPAVVAPAAVLEPAAPQSTPAPVEAAPAPTAAIEPVAPVASSDALAPVEIPFEYTVKPGDTLEDVAKTFGVTSQQILDANGLGAASEVSTGLKIKIPMPGP